MDFLIEDFDKAIPIEFKSLRDYQIHSALNKLLEEDSDSIEKAYVLNQRNTMVKGKNLHSNLHGDVLL